MGEGDVTVRGGTVLVARDAVTGGRRSGLILRRSGRVFLRKAEILLGRDRDGEGE